MWDLHTKYVGTIESLAVHLLIEVYQLCANNYHP